MNRPARLRLDLDIVVGWCSGTPDWMGEVSHIPDCEHDTCSLGGASASIIFISPVHLFSYDYVVGDAWASDPVLGIEHFAFENVHIRSAVGDWPVPGSHVFGDVVFDEENDDSH